MIGTQVKDYRIIQEIGKGGMASVFLVEHTMLHNQAALKLLNQEYVRNEHIRKRFLAEARSMARMSHAGVVKVTDLIEENDTVAFVMEYIDGETLKEYLDRKGKLRDDEIKTIFSQMLEALGYVHEQNLVHRDIKPSNFMIDKKGKVKLMDFGIAKTLDPASSEYTQTGTGMQMGTPMYMSPEQITETKSVTSQSDIYSLGVVLWQMATGQKPYDTKTLSNFQLQMKIVQEPLLSTNSRWDTIIYKCTDKDVRSRFFKCSEISQAINTGSVKADSSDSTVVESIGANAKQDKPRSEISLEERFEQERRRRDGDKPSLTKSNSNEIPKPKKSKKMALLITYIVLNVIGLLLISYDQLYYVDDYEYEYDTSVEQYYDEETGIYVCNNGKEISSDFVRDGYCDCDDCEDED